MNGGKLRALQGQRRALWRCPVAGLNWVHLLWFSFVFVFLIRPLSQASKLLNNSLGLNHMLPRSDPRLAGWLCGVWIALNWDLYLFTSGTVWDMALKLDGQCRKWGHDTISSNCCFLLSWQAVSVRRTSMTVCQSREYPAALTGGSALTRLGATAAFVCQALQASDAREISTNASLILVTLVEAWTVFSW